MAGGVSGETGAPRVVIVGGGFGGLSCARELADTPVDVVLVDRRDYHQFTPLLYQVATALLTAPDISYPFRAAFRDAPNLGFRQAAAGGFDLERQVVRTAASGELPYDYLVLATGAENDYFGNQALAAHTLSMKTLPQAQRLRNHVLACLERAAQSEDEAERRRWLTFVVVGAGPTGVEFTGALVELLKLVLGREYRELSPALARVVLVEGTPAVLPPFPTRLGRYARRALERRGVEVLTTALVEDASDDGVRLSDGRVIPSRTIVWSAGVRPSEPIDIVDAPRSRSGRLATDPWLRLPDHPTAFAIGDLASVQGPGGELPMLSPPAMQEGRYVARAILDDVRGTGRGAPFRYRDRGTMAVIGRNAAVARLPRLELTGLLGWLAWLTVHLYYLIGFRNRLVVLLNWAWDYVRKDRPIRMITTSDPDPIVEGAPAANDDAAPAARTDRRRDGSARPGD
jgi:NADH dehydrogenase